MIHNMLQKIKSFLNTYKLILLGFLIFSLYFWSRFLRSRTSKVLPLNLSILGFFTLSYICMIFIYILISLLFPRTTNDIIEKIIDWLFTPIGEFDKYLKTIPIIKHYFEVSLMHLLPKLEFLIIQTNILYVILWILPRMILLSALYIDVFYFHKLHYKYYVVLFGLLLFLNRYMKYSLKNYKNQLIEDNKIYIDTIATPYVFGIHPAELAPDYDPNDPDEQDVIEFMYLPFEIFIKFQTESIVYQGITRNIQSIGFTLALLDKMWREHLHEPFKYYSIKDLPKDYKNIFGDKIPDNYHQAKRLIREKYNEFTSMTLKNIIRISLLIEYYNKTSNQNKKIRKIKILIYTNYLLCWLYVLIISSHTLNIEELIIVLMRTWLLLQDPFTDIFIHQYKIF